MKYLICITLIFLLYFFLLKKELFSGVQRYDNDKILSTNYAINGTYEHRQIRKKNGWDTYWDKKSSSNFSNYSIFDGTKFKNYIKNLDLGISL